MNQLAARLLLVFHPRELEHRIGEEEAATRRPLARVFVGCAFDEAAPDEVVGLRSAGGGHDQQVIEEEIAHEDLTPAESRPIT